MGDWEMTEQVMSRDFIRRHTAVELALDILGRAENGRTPEVKTVIKVATELETYLSGRSR